MISHSHKNKKSINYKFILLFLILFFFRVKPSHLYCLYQKSSFKQKIILDSLDLRYYKGTKIAEGGDSHGIIVKIMEQTLIKKGPKRHIHIDILKKLPKHKHVMEVLRIQKKDSDILYEFPYDPISSI